MADYDLAIIGAGPAGTVLASLVRRQDPSRRVLIVEREVFPRHRVGESLIAGIGPILARAGLLESIEAMASVEGNPAGIVRKAGAVFYWGPEERDYWTADFREPDTGRPAPGSYQVDRARFDAYLLEHAKRLGAEHVTGEVVEAVEREDSVELAYRAGGETHRVTASYVVDASGQARCLSRLLGVAHERLDDMNNYAVYGYWRRSERLAHGAPLKTNEAWTFISTTRDGWCWHIHIGESLVSIGLVTNRDAIPSGGEDALRAFYLENVRACEGVGDLVAGATLVTKPGARELNVVKDWSSRAARFCGERWFLVGDAAAFVDPILGSGVMLAITGAATCANALTTLWDETPQVPPLDPGLLRESYQQTYLDLVSGYHRLAQVWYRQNDRLRSWWWEARRAGLGGEASTRAADLRGFLSFAMGLVRDPFAGRARDQGLEIDPVRPDKVLFARNLFRDAELVEQRLHVTLEHLTRMDHGELEARGVLYAHLSRRWRQLLDAPVRLSALELRERRRYYTDRTLDRWIPVRFVECMEPGARDFLDRIVLPGDTPPGAPLGVPHADGDPLRASLERALADVAIGSQPYRALLDRVFTRVTELDVRGWIHADGAPDPADEDELLKEASELAGVGALRLSVDLLGRALELELPDAPCAIQLVAVPPGASAPPAYRQLDGFALSYVRGEPAGETAALLARLADADPGALSRLADALAKSAGLCLDLTPDGGVARMPRDPTDPARAGSG